MKKKPILIIVAVIIMVVIGNFTPVGILFGKPIIHQYHSSDGGYQEHEFPEKGRALDFITGLSWNTYKTLEN